MPKLPVVSGADVIKALSQVHTTTTQYEHYLNMQFEEEDRREMRKLVEE